MFYLPGVGGGGATHYEVLPIEDPMRAQPLPPPAFSQFGHRLVCPIESPPAPRSWDVGLAILKHESYAAVPYPAHGLKIA